MRRSSGGVATLLAPLTLVVVASALTACNDSAGPEENDVGQVIELDLRVHVLESATLTQLTGRSTDTEVQEMMVAVNDIWEQANVFWNLESVVREEALNVDGYEALLAGQVSDPSTVLLSVFPREGLLVGGWNVFLVHLLGAAPGIYVSSPAMQAIFVAEAPVPGESVTVAAPRILAHELGHSLSLVHVPCTADGNLMAPGCDATDRTRLDEAQIVAARRQAGTRQQFVFTAAGGILHRAR